MRSTLWRDYDRSFNGLRPLLHQIDALFGDTVAAAPQTTRQAEISLFRPEYHVSQTEDQYVLSFDVPGIARDDLNLEITGTQLVVSGERKARGDRFSYEFTLPPGVTGDGAAAEYKDGVLTLTLAKPAAAKATKIKISEGSLIKAPEAVPVTN